MNMSMSKKDFEAIASILRQQADGEDETARGAIYELAGNLADYFAETNPLFDHGRFETAVKGGRG